MLPPVALLLIGMVAVVGAIALLRLNAFVALIGAAIIVSLLAPGDALVKITRVAEGFGRTAGTIGIVIALAAIMITTAGMLAAILRDVDALPYHRVYVATAIASGSLVGTWMNDSRFWAFSKMGGTTESRRSGHGRGSLPSLERPRW